MHNHVNINKRGLSPLIASVLLIAFTVALFLIISNFVRKEVVETSLEEGGKQVSKTLDCLSTKLKIVSACHTLDTAVIVSFDNDGDVILKGYSVRVLGTDGAFTEQITGNVNPLERKKYQKTGITGVTGINKVEVYPVVESGICQSSLVSKENIATC